MLNVSKWIKIPVLLDVEEMKSLFSSLSSFQLYQVQKITSKGEGTLSPSAFLNDYASYIEYLKNGEEPPSQFGALFSPVLSVTEEAMIAMPVEGERQLYKPQLPVIQMQAHAIRYSPLDRSFRSQLFGSDAISWGIQFGYPQIYADPKTHAIFPTRDMPNGPLFHEIQRWVRKWTSPTPFIIDGKKENVPIRLGKTCFSWINAHPQLQKQGMKIARTTDSSSVCKK